MLWYPQGQRIHSAATGVTQFFIPHLVLQKHTDPYPTESEYSKLRAYLRVIDMHMLKQKKEYTKPIIRIDLSS